MFAFNEAWLINESLALHVSTNTFNNPTFDEDHIDSANNEAPAVGLSSDRSPAQQQSKELGCNKSGLQKTTNQSFGSNFADNLAFSIRSKLFVIDLNFKRKLRSLKAFVINHLPSLFDSTTSSRKSVSRNKARFMSRNKIYDCDEQFWENIVEPSSRKSLGKQKEKILSRLERALEQKRKQPGGYQQQQQQEQEQVERNSKTTSNQFGPNAITKNGLGHIRPGIICHPLYQESQSSLSASTSSSRSSSASIIAGAQSSLYGKEPMMIGSQNLVSIMAAAESVRARVRAKECTQCAIYI